MDAQAVKDYLVGLQARIVARAQAAGPITLTLRPLGDGKAVAEAAAPTNAEENTDGNVTVIRFGLTPSSSSGRK